MKFPDVRRPVSPVVVKPQSIDNVVPRGPRRVAGMGGPPPRAISASTAAERLPDRTTTRATPRNRRLWRPVIVIACLLLIGTLLFMRFTEGEDDGKAGLKSSSGTATIAPTTDPSTIRLLATGDFIAHDSVNSAAKQSDGTYHYLPMMADFEPIFQKADVRFCNDPILNGGKPFGIIGYPNFNSPTEFVTDMGKLGCNLVNTASNHSFDKTQEVISASVAAWDDVPNMLAVAGQNRNQTEHDTVHYFTVKGVKIAFLAYTTYSNGTLQNNYGVNFFSQALAKQQIAQAKQNGAQFIIASMRWGTEYSGMVSAAQKQNAQFLADQGVSLVLGHGPHVLQPVEQLTGSGGNQAMVWYSLGNFINTQLPTETLFNGVAVMDIDVKTKQLSNVRYLPIYMHYEWTAAQAAAETLSARHNLHLYLLEAATQAMIDAQQLKTTAAAQKERISGTLNANGLQIPLITAKDF